MVEDDPYWMTFGAYWVLSIYNTNVAEVDLAIAYY